MQKEKIAYQRFTLIAPALNGTHGYESNAEYFRNLCQIPVVCPVTGKEKVYSSRTLVYWLHRYKLMGMDGLLPGDRKDHGYFRALTGDIQNRIDEIIEKYPRIPNTEVLKRLKKEGLCDDSLSQSTIDRYIRAAHHEKKLPVIHEDKERKAFEFKCANTCWQADTTFLQKLHGRKVCLMLIIDDASRMVVGYGFFHHDTAENFLTVLKSAISVYGVPKLLYMDNGAPYANQQLEMVCGDLGTQIVHAPVRDGAAKGKIERLNRTLKQGWLSQTDWMSFDCLEDIDNSFRLYLYPEYINKPHSSLVDDCQKALTPRERFLKDSKLIRHLPHERLDEIFTIRYERKVRTDSTVQINRVRYEVPSELMNEKVQIYMEPLNSEKVWVEDPFTKKRIPIKRLNKIENSRIRRRQHMHYPAASDRDEGM